MLKLLENIWLLIRHYFVVSLNTTYISLPLDATQRDIRLVYLQRGNWRDDIRCRLTVVSLESKPDFEALSYAWGEASETRPIIVDGKRIEVGANLESALRRLRRTHEDRALWADAICINQHDVQERNSQVLLMKDIYGACQSALIWLGYPENSQRNNPPSKPHEWLTVFSKPDDIPELHEIDQKTINDFVNEIQIYYRLPFSLRHSIFIDKYLGAYCLLTLLAQNKHVTERDIPFLLNHDAFHRFILALEEIMHCQWWSRQWVIQEVVLPATVKVHFGNFVAPWELFGRAANNYERHRTSCCGEHYTALHWNDIRLLEQFSRSVVEMDNLRRNWQNLKLGDQGALVTLRQLLWRFRDRSTTDPRDKIYTLLPLVTYWNKENTLNPDYYPKPQQVFCAAVKTVVAVDNSLDILMGTMEKNLPGLPSWVPDWTRKASRFEEERLERCSLFRASLDHKLDVEFIQDTCLRVSGILFDEISFVAETMDFSDEERCQELFADWYALVSRDAPITASYPGGSNRLNAYWRTLCLDTARSFSNMDIGKRYSRCSRHYVEDSQKKWMNAEGKPLRHNLATETMKSDTKVMTKDLEEVLFPIEEECANSETVHKQGSSESLRHDDRLNFVAVDFAICSATWNRRLFFTKKGYFGLGPPSIEEGDTVHVFSGGSMPFAVCNAGPRKIHMVGEQSCYYLRGECYVHGIMDGEGVRMFEQEKQFVYLV
ncbi:heterokaryon incompatibility protein-domain-containing protein [Phaeosphaeriaceae sp. PMI808]|nr:heterokaryon incompatibility protein-domain-containing protein [Phaeosphaeriaceae sp. PMI808]